MSEKCSCHSDIKFHTQETVISNYSHMKLAKFGRFLLIIEKVIDVESQRGHFPPAPGLDMVNSDRIRSHKGNQQQQKTATRHYPVQEKTSLIFSLFEITRFECFLAKQLSIKVARGYLLD